MFEDDIEMLVSNLTNDQDLARTPEEKAKDIMQALHDLRNLQTAVKINTHFLILSSLWSKRASLED